MAFNRVGPNQGLVGNVAFARCVNALEPRLVFPPPYIAADGYVDPVVVKDGHATDETGADFSVANVLMHVFLRRGGVAIESPCHLQGTNFRRRGAVPGVERINDAVSTAVMGYDPQADHMQFPFPGENHLSLLAARGVGTHDVGQIEVGGLTIAQATHPFNPRRLEVGKPIFAD